jgi:hypothetical protein
MSHTLSKQGAPPHSHASPARGIGSHVWSCAHSSNTHAEAEGQSRLVAHAAPS